MPTLFLQRFVVLFIVFIVFLWYGIHFFVHFIWIIFQLCSIVRFPMSANTLGNFHFESSGWGSINPALSQKVLPKKIYHNTINFNLGVLNHILCVVPMISVKRLCCQRTFIWSQSFWWKPRLNNFKFQNPILTTWVNWHLPVKTVHKGEKKKPAILASQWDIISFNTACN